MKKTLLITALALGASIYGFAQPQLLLHGMKSFNVCPPELTSSNTPMPQIVNDGSATIYNSDFSVVKTIMYNETKPYGGNLSDTARIQPNGVTIGYFNVYQKLQKYDMTTSSYVYLEASTAEEMITQLKDYSGSSSNYKSFIDLNGNIACYYDYDQTLDSYKSNFYNYDTYGTKYPRSYYIIKDGIVCGANAQYSPTYDESSAVWKEASGAKDSTVAQGPYTFNFYDYDSNSYPDKSFSFTQTLFNDDANWEYTVESYDTKPIKIYYSYINRTTNSDGTITLYRNGYYVYPVTGIQIKNDNGAVVYTLSPNGLSNSESKYLYSYYIHYVMKMNGKFYVGVRYTYCTKKEGDSSYDYESGYDLYLLDKKSGTASKVGSTDVNGDGTTDVKDLNAVVNTICGK